MTPTRSQQYTWTFLLVVPAAGLAVGVKGLITGAPGNPALISALTGLEWEQLRSQQPGVARLVSVLVRHESIALLGWGFWLTWSFFNAPPNKRLERPAHVGVFDPSPVRRSLSAIR